MSRARGRLASSLPGSTLVSRRSRAIGPQRSQRSRRTACALGGARNAPRFSIDSFRRVSGGCSSLFSWLEEGGERNQGPARTGLVLPCRRGASGAAFSRCLEGVRGAAPLCRLRLPYRWSVRVASPIGELQSESRMVRSTRQSTRSVNSLAPHGVPRLFIQNPGSLRTPPNAASCSP